MGINEVLGRAFDLYLSGDSEGAWKFINAERDRMLKESKKIHNPHPFALPGQLDMFKEEPDGNENQGD